MDALTRNFYLYADETGQDTAGALFVVAIVLVENDQREEMEALFERLEQRTRRGPKKWPRTSLQRRHAMVQAVPVLAPMVREACRHDCPPPGRGAIPRREGRVP